MVDTLIGGIGESWTGLGDEFDANATAADALVVAAPLAKHWKERLDSRDRALRGAARRGPEPGRHQA